MTVGIDLSKVRPGFPDPVHNSQSVFRAIMEAVARPGMQVTLSPAPTSPAPLCPAAGAVALTLLDFETPVWLSPAIREGEARDWLRFHCGCPLVDETEASAFAFISRADEAPPLSAFNPGDAKYPDRSTTVILQVFSLDGGSPVRLAGPGIKGERVIAPRGLPADVWDQVAENGAAFQFGVDILLVAEEGLIGLPRTVRIQS